VDDWYGYSTLYIIRLFLTPKLGTVTDRIQAAQIAAFARPFDLLDLLLTCTNRRPSPTWVRYRGPTGLIAKSWFRHRQNRSLTDFLFSVDGTAGFNDPWNAEEMVLRVESSTRQDPNDLVVIELLQSKTDSFSQAWRALCGDKSHHVTADVVQIVATLCIVTAVFVECLPQSHGFRLQELRKSSQRLWEEMCSFLSFRDVDFIQACLEVLSPVVSSAPCLSDPGNVISRALETLAPPLLGVLEQQRHDQQMESTSFDAESMDLDDPFPAHDDQLPVQQSIVSLNREALPFFPDSLSFQRCMTVQLSIFNKGKPMKGNEQFPNSTLIEYMTSLDEADILSAYSILPNVFSACSGMTRAAALDVIEYFGEKCLQSYHLERCESSLCLCIYMMVSFVDLWTSGEGDDLYDSASDLYAWFVDVLLARKKASSRVLIALAELLDAVISSNPKYSSAESSPSPRTSFFNILQDGDIRVKFSVAKLVPNIFGRFILKDHDAIFDDVLDSLPRDPDWSEGIAFRLYALAQLASRWHTLLRRSIYHMFETPGKVPLSVRYAEKCLRDVSHALGLDDAKEIFRLFSSQILYTWTKTQSVSSMPFSIFGYTSLKEMLTDVRDEVVGQIMMRADDHEAAELSTCLNTPFIDLLGESFYKAEAYSIARDISIPPSQDSQPKGVENRIKKQLGADRFLSLVERHFPQIVAALFKSLDQEEQIERAFLKRPNFRFALEILKRIIAKSASTVTLPANQQPSFRARYLLDELEFLCKRTGYELETIWTPALVSFVCRSLLESIHHALGSLHACSVLRKIRILVCVAGPVMLQDYPLEQLLHALRPFLTDFHCSEDALGIFWYLLEAGRPYLLENPGFTAGIAVSTLASLRGFLTSSPESSTQESQFRVVVSKTQEFLDWFAVFLEDYKSPNMSEETAQSFRRMVRSSQRMCTAGNATKGTYESELLLELLQDRSTGRNLLSRPISDLVLSLLCSGFQKPPDFRNDILGEDKAAAANAVAVWQTIQNGSHEAEYRLWAARVLGRAYAATGQISDVLLREQDPALFKNHEVVQRSSPYSASKVAILQVLCDMLLSSNRMEVGLVERTLQLIISKLVGHPELEQCGHAIPPSLMKALIWNPYHCPNISLSPSEASGFGHTMSWDPKLSAPHWARSIALSLSIAAEDDPVIGPLSKILYTIPGLAVRLLPYVLHDVLLSEIEGEQTSRQKISEVFQQALRDVNEDTIPHVRLIINSILYLRNQPKPHESTIAEREEWLDIDYGEAAAAACRCRMYKTSLLFVEIQASRQASVSRRSSFAKYSPPTSLLHEIFRNIDDPDFFYGIQQEPSLDSVMEKLDYESAGIKNLLFQSAQYDSDIQMTGDANACGIIKALNATNLQGIASSMFSAASNAKGVTAPLESMLETAMSLQQWDIPIPSLAPSASGVLFRAFQSLNTSSNGIQVLESLDECFLAILDRLVQANKPVTSLRASMRALGILTEIDEALSSTSSDQIEEEWEKIRSRNFWLKTERYVHHSVLLKEMHCGS